MEEEANAKTASGSRWIGVSFAANPKSIRGSTALSAPGGYFPPFLGLRPRDLSPKRHALKVRVQWLSQSG
jgi:hypothetical protein